LNNERQEEGDKHMTKPEICASEVPCGCYLIFASIEEQNFTENNPLLQLAAHCGGGVVSRCLPIWVIWHHLAALDLRDAPKAAM
jgi:hypothetical protein